MLRPVADGGEGTVAAALRAGYRPRQARVSGPDGRPGRRAFALRRDDRGRRAGHGGGARAARPPAPLTATTRGVGELVGVALDAGCPADRARASAAAPPPTAGPGCCRRPGVRLLDADGADVPPGGGGLARLDRVDATGLDPRLAGVEFVVASDVDNPLTGPPGAAARLRAAEGRVARAGGRARRGARPLRRRPGAGTWGRRRRTCRAPAAPAGRRPARWPSGRGVVLRGRPGLRPRRAGRALAGAGLVITGEGSLDEQTLTGKAPAEVARRAAAAGVAVPGRGRRRPAAGRRALAAAGFAAAHALTEVEPDVARCLAEPEPCSPTWRPVSCRRTSGAADQPASSRDRT